jgi:hypothetical protein
MIGVPILEGEKQVGTLCREPSMEVSRKPDGEERWCFYCRKRTTFERVITMPTFPSYYGPNFSVRCTRAGHDDGDMFPGYYRVWGED